MNPIEYSLSLVPNMILVLNQEVSIEAKWLLDVFSQYLQDQNFNKMSENIRNIDLNKVSCFNSLSNSTLFLDIIYPE